MSASPLVLLALLGAPALAASEFVQALRRAESRAASDPERVEYATRAIRAWSSGDGRLMLAAAHLRRAEGLLLRRELPEAVEDLTKTVENDPANRLALRLRGEARLELGKPFDAENDFNECVRLEPGDADCWVGLGRARLPERGSARPADARKAAARARRLAPEDWRPDWVDGRAYLRERRPDDALASLARSVALAKGRPEPHAERAAAHESVGRHAEAAADWSEAIPAYERAKEAGERARAPERARALERERLAAAFYSRGRLREFLMENEGALDDYAQACALGHKDACAKRPAGGEAAAKRARRPKAAPAELDPPEPVRPKAKKRRVKTPKSDPGERVYAN
jgi:tetratricopeptide (TPR) repeat protein